MIAPDQRPDRLRTLRDLKMARSAHAYVRGSTSKFYEWLEACPSNVPQGPSVWICGDCHIGNLGPIADIKGNVAVQIRDLDQTVIGNPAHDLIRLALSLASAARGSDLPGVATAHILEHLMLGYETTMAGDFTVTAKRPRGRRPFEVFSIAQYDDGGGTWLRSGSIPSNRWSHLPKDSGRLLRRTPGAG